MLLAVAMVMSLCVNVFAMKQVNYNNGANEETLRINGTETEFKIVVFDSDQNSKNTTENHVEPTPRAVINRNGLTLTAQEIAEGYGFYDVNLNARLIWSGQEAGRMISGGGLVLAVHPDAASGKNPYPSQDKMKDLLITDTAVKDVLTTYVPGSNMENEENKGIYKLRLALSYGTETPKRDVKGNYYHDFYIGLQGMKGKPGDKFEIKLISLVVADGDDTIRFNGNGLTSGKVYGATKTVSGFVTIPTTITFDLNGGTGTVPADVDDLGKGDKIAMPPVGDRAKPNAVLVGWSKTQTSLITDRSQLPADMGPVGGEYTLTDPTVQKLYAVWAEHKLPDPVDDEGDPIPTPDYDKIIVNFKVVGGRWTAENSDVRTVMLMADDYGNARLGAAQIPVINASTVTRSNGYQLPGIWSVDKIGAPVTPNATYDYRLSEKEYTYTYTLGTKGTTYIYLNGDDAFEHIDLDPSDPRNPSDPRLDDTIYDTDDDAYIITEIGVPDDDNVITVVAYPDDDRNGIPDRFQRDRTFKIVNGTWDGANSEDIVVSVPIKFNGQYVMGPNGNPLGGGDLVSLGLIPDTANAVPVRGACAGSGRWKPDPYSDLGRLVEWDNSYTVHEFHFCRYAYVDGLSGGIVEVNPNDPRNPAEPKTGDRIFDVGEGKYVVTNVGANPAEVGGNIIVTVMHDGDDNNIPDKFEVSITFKIRNGYWQGTDNTDKRIVTTVKYNGGYKWDDVNNRPMGEGTYTVQDVTNARPDSTHDLPGAWASSDPAALGAPTGTILGSQLSGKGPYEIIFVYDFESKLVVSYGANGGAGDMLPSYVARGSSVTVAENGFDAPSGKRFKEWNTAPDGSGNPYQPGEAFMPVTDTVLYAIWEDAFSSDIGFEDESGNAVDIVKVLRPVGMDHANTGEPMDWGYDSNMVSRSVRVMLSGQPAGASAAEVQHIQNMLDNAKYERYTRNGFEVISMDELLKYIDRPRAEVADGEIAAVFTSRAPGVIRLTFENGYEFAIVTPGDVNFDGEMNANDWATVMRWCMEAPASWDMTDPPGFTVNGTEYDLWALLADMTSVRTDGARGELVDNIDWMTMMFILLQAWKN